MRRKNYVFAFSCVNLISVHCSYSFLIKNKNQKAWWCYQVRKEFPIPVICMDNDTKMKKKKQQPKKSRQNFEAVVQYISLAHNKRNSPLTSFKHFYNLSARVKLLLIRGHVIHTKDLLSCMSMQIN